MSNKGDSLQSDEEIALETLQQKLSDEISETVFLVRRIKEAASHKDIEEQMVEILEKLQTLQKKIDRALQSSEPT